MKKTLKVVSLFLVHALWSAPSGAQKTPGIDMGTKANFQARVQALKALTKSTKPTIEELAKKGGYDLDTYKKEVEIIGKIKAEDAEKHRGDFKSFEARFGPGAKLFEPVSAEARSIKGLGDPGIIGWLTLQKFIALHGAVPGSVVEDPKGEIKLPGLSQLRSHGLVVIDAGKLWGTVHAMQEILPGYQEGGVVFGTRAPVGNEKTKVRAEVQLQQHLMFAVVAPAPPPSVANAHAAIRLRVMEGSSVVCEVYHTALNATVFLPIPFVHPAPSAPTVTIGCEGSRSVNTAGELSLEVEIRGSVGVYGFGHARMHYGAQIKQARLFAALP